MNLEPTVGTSSTKNQWFQRLPDVSSRHKWAGIGMVATKFATKFPLMKAQSTVAPPQHRLCFLLEPQGHGRSSRPRQLAYSPRLPIQPFLNVRRTPLLQCLQQFGRAGPVQTLTPDSRSSEIAPPPHVRPCGAGSKSPSHSGFRRASHAFLSIPNFGFHAEKGTAGSCNRRNEPQDVPKSCFVASGAGS